MPSTHKLKIGVMGSASGPQVDDAHARKMAAELGMEIGRRGHIFINGACPGLPHDALLGAKETGSFTIGISPAFSITEHVKEYRSPVDNEMIIYTGQGFMERDIINIRSSDGVCFISGGIGTLNELTIAYDEGRPIGVLTDTGGISNSIPLIIEKLCMRRIPPNMVFDSDPKTLVTRVIEMVQKRKAPEFNLAKK